MSINCYSGRLTKAHVIRAFGIRDDPDPAIGSDLDHPGSVWLSDIEKAVVRQRQSDGLSQVGWIDLFEKGKLQRGYLAVRYFAQAVVASVSDDQTSVRRHDNAARRIK